MVDSKRNRANEAKSFDWSVYRAVRVEFLSHLMHTPYRIIYTFAYLPQGGGKKWWRCCKTLKVKDSDLRIDEM